MKLQSIVEKRGTPFTVILFIVVLVVLLFFFDFIVSRLKLNDIEIIFDAPTSMVATGNSKLTIDVTVLEKGEPRGGDMVQCWIVEGDGKLLPGYFFLDEEGKGKTVFTPTRPSRYSPKTAVLAFEDISIGRLIEVSKKTELHVNLLEPE